MAVIDRPAEAAVPAAEPTAPAAAPARPRRWERPFLAVLLALLLVQGALYALIVPPLQSPDEPAHLANLLLVAEAGRPVVDAERSAELEASIAAWMEPLHYWYYRWEAVPDPLPARLDAGIRPPLYYLLVSALAAPFAPDSLTAWLLWGRAVSVLLATATAALIFFAAREMTPRDPFVPVVAAAFAGLLPLQAYVGATVTSDNLANFLAGALFYLMARSLTRGLSAGRIVGLAAVMIASFGAIVLGSFLTKLSGLFLVVPAAVVPLLVVWARRSLYPRGRFLTALGVLGAAALIGAILLLRYTATIDWYLRNRVLYPGMIERALGRDFGSPEFLGALVDHAGTVYRQFWGSFGWLTVEVPDGWYAAWAVVVGLAILGIPVAVARRWWPVREREPSTDDLVLRRARAAFVVGLVVWLLASLATFVGLFAFAADIGGGVQGRYLLPDLAPIAFLLAFGWRALLPHTLRRPGAVALVGWFLLFNAAALTTAIIPAFYLSPYR